MKRLLIASAILGLSAISSFAADLPVRAYSKAPALAPVSNWSGFYVGGNIGYSWEDPTVSTTGLDQGTNLGGYQQASPPLSFDIKGVTGGAQVGYNWMVNPVWLFGIETDFNFADVKGGAAANTLAFGNTPLNYSANENVKWFGTVRGRVGYLVTPSLLVFGTGGFAYGRVEQSVALVNFVGGGSSSGAAPQAICPAGPSVCQVGSSNRIATGATAGGGLEYMIWKNWTMKAEYLYTNLGSNDFQSVFLRSSNGPSVSAIHFTDTVFHTVRFGANFHF